MAKRFDVVVIGSGVAGGLAARACVRAGRSVAVADHRPYGGTCPLRGCEPKKVLADAAHLSGRVRALQGKGLRGEAAVDWPALQRFKHSFVDPMPKSVEEGLAGLGVATLHGLARFEGPNRLRVGEEAIEAGKILIAAGATPRPLDFPGAEHLLISDDFLDFEELPSRIAFVGGGYVSMEFAHVAALAGAKATIFQRSDRCLRRFDVEIVDELCRHSGEMGIDIRFNAPAHSIEKTEGGFLTRGGRFGEIAVEADAVIHGAGRVADVAPLECDRGGVEVLDGRVAVDEFLRSVSNPDVYVAGDVTGRGPQLTPVAVIEANAVAHNLLHGDERKPDYSVVPSACYAFPTIASVGLREEEAQAQGVRYEKKVRTRLTWPEFRRLGEECAAYKLLVDPDKKTILGAHLLGEDAEEVVNILALAMRHGLTTGQLMDMVWSYPSFGYTLRYMLHDLAADSD